MDVRKLSGVAAAILLVLLTPFSASSRQSAPVHFDRTRLVEIAELYAKRPYEPPPEVPEAFRNLGYDAYRDFEYRWAKRLWRGERRGFEADFMHAGFLYKHAVEFFEVVDGIPSSIEYDPGLFRFGPAIPPVPDDPPNMFSGFRLHAPLNRRSRMDEFLVFQGASYFRALAAGQVHGLSARGLAVNTAEPGGEDFPSFRTFWIERPAKHSRTTTVHALLDSRSAVGAFTFQITPGPQTRMRVTAEVFPRRGDLVIGLAPLTSMYLFGPANRHRFDDFRGEVHDSDGLLMWTSDDEWLWRPLRNPGSLQTSFFQDQGPRGFGLLQRQRDPDKYNDWEARYDLRPGAWVEPIGDWGRGSVELVEIPTNREYADNIVAFWRPEQPPGPGESLTYSYWLTWGEFAGSKELARVGATRSGLTMIERRQFVVDFEPPAANDEDGKRGGEGPPAPPPFGKNVDVDLSARGGRILYPVAEWSAEAGLYRVTFQLETEDVQSSVMRLLLRRAGKPVSETWRYRWERQ